jgi:hypothetical protein
MGALQVYGTAAGVNLDVTVPAATVGQIPLGNTISQGSGRVVGMAFEVVNTTAEIAKQGQTTVYRQPQSHPTGDTWISATVAPVIDIPFSAHAIRSPPINQAQAMLYPGSRQWMAKEGCYVVQTFVGQDNPPQVVRYDQPVVIQNPTQEDFAAATNAYTVLAPLTGQMIPGANGMGMNVATKIYPLHMGGAIFTGLSSTSTLTLTQNVFYETFPSTAETDILVLATPSAQYDPIALEIFSHCLSSMPVGVPASDNAEGSWFDGLMSIIRDVAPIAAPILSAFHPAFGIGAVAAGRMADSYLVAPNANRKPKMKPLPPLPPPKLSMAQKRQVLALQEKRKKKPPPPPKPRPRG